MQASAIILSQDPELRSGILGWAWPDDVQFLFYDDAGEALAAARKHPVRLFLADARAPRRVGEGVLRRLHALPGAPEILLLVDPGERPDVALPLDSFHDGPVPSAALEEQALRLVRLAGVREISGLVGSSPAMRGLLNTIAQVAPLDVPVLIQGESGTGKEVVARALHRASRRHSGPFESLNVGSVAETLLESELFGHEKGAFTGAVARREGVFERADSGTLFLDELGEMPPSMQVRLLRVLETREFLRVGGVQTLSTDVRLVAATHRSLEEEMSAGRFRSDLYYRLKVVKIEIPPLRERRDDIPALISHFIDEANERHGLALKGVTREAMERMLAYAWPGNVRELRNVLASMSVLARGEHLGVEDLPPELDSTGQPRRALPMPYGDGSSAHTDDPLLTNTLLALMAELRRVHERLDRIESALHPHAAPPSPGIPLDEVGDEAEYIPLHPEMGGDLAGAERAMIEAALKRQSGNRRQTAEQLGISERTLYRKLKAYGLG